MLYLNIDEMTIVILLKDTNKLSLHNWDSLAERIIVNVENILSLKKIFGEKEFVETKNIQGYNKGYTYGLHPFYFRVCYHEYQHSMGVAIRFSAQSLIYYRSMFEKEFGTTIEPYEIVRYINARLPDYTVRCSRIDLYADYIDENINVDELRKQLDNGEYCIYSIRESKNGKYYMPSSSKLHYTNVDGKVDTIYIGIGNKGVNSILRIYNKKLEQIKNYGIRYEEAVNCKNWVRFENEIHGKYAHSITKELLNINSNEELGELIASCILNKYTIMNKNNDRYIATKLLENLRNNNAYRFKNIKYTNNSLSKQLDYLMNKSGLISFVQKLFEIGDTKLVLHFFTYLKEESMNRAKNRDTTKWLKENKKIYLANEIHLFDKYKNTLVEAETEEKECQPSLASFNYKLIENQTFPNKDYSTSVERKTKG